MDPQLVAYLLAGGKVPMPRADPRYGAGDKGLMGLDPKEVISSEDQRFIDPRSWAARLPGKLDNARGGVIHPQGLLEKRGYDPSLGYGDFLGSHTLEDVTRQRNYMRDPTYWKGI